MSSSYYLRIGQISLSFSWISFSIIVISFFLFVIMISSQEVTSSHFHCCWMSSLQILKRPCSLRSLECNLLSPLSHNFLFYKEYMKYKEKVNLNWIVSAEWIRRLQCNLQYYQMFYLIAFVFAIRNEQESVEYMAHHSYCCVRLNVTRFYTIPQSGCILVKKGKFRLHFAASAVTCTAIAQCLWICIVKWLFPHPVAVYKRLDIDQPLLTFYSLAYLQSDLPKHPSCFPVRHISSIPSFLVLPSALAPWS